MRIPRSWCFAALTLSASLVLVILIGRTRGYPPRSTTSLEEIRGEQIDPVAPSNTTTQTQPPAAVGRKQYPKPASFQRRMVEYHVNRTDGANQESNEVFTASPAKIVFSRAQVEAMPDKSIPTNYEMIAFSKLAGFSFEVTREMVDATNNPTSASGPAEAKIPTEILALDKKEVAIRGFLLPLKMDEGLAVEFLLMRDQNLCCFGTVPKINEWIDVRTNKGVKPVMDQPITVLGRLHVGEIRENGFLVGIYQMQAENIYGP